MISMGRELSDSLHRELGALLERQRDISRIHASLQDSIERTLRFIAAAADALEKSEKVV